MSTAILDAEVLESQEVYEAATRAEIDRQIATAHAFPRDVAASVKRAKALVATDGETAEECIYALPRGGSVIRGPSVRLAEIIAYSWTNLRVQTRVVSVGQREVVCQAACHDLETNVATVSEVRRRIIDSRGKRYSDDMIVKTANAGCAIARRNAVFSVLPKALWKPVLKEAERLVAGGDKKLTMAQRRENALRWFDSKGKKRDEVLEFLGVKKLTEVNEGHLVDLTGIRNAVLEGTAEMDDVFAHPREKVELGGEEKTPEAVKEPDPFD